MKESLFFIFSLYIITFLTVVKEISADGKALCKSCKISEYLYFGLRFFSNFNVKFLIFKNTKLFGGCECFPSGSGLRFFHLVSGKLPNLSSNF